jgi:hypothetical protein
MNESAAVANTQHIKPVQKSFKRLTWFCNSDPWQAPANASDAPSTPSTRSTHARKADARLLETLLVLDSILSASFSAATAMVAAHLMAERQSLMPSAMSSAIQ